MKDTSDNTHSHKRVTTAPKGGIPLSRREKLNRVLILIAEQGYTQRAAAAQYGMNEKSLSRALHRPDVQQALEDMKLRAAEDLEHIKDRTRRLAYKVGKDLLENSPSDQVKARMVELFSGERSGSPQVQVNVTQNGGGYEYARPGQRVVDIKPVGSTERATISGAPEALVIENTGFRTPTGCIDPVSAHVRPDPSHASLDSASRARSTQPIDNAQIIADDGQ